MNDTTKGAIALFFLLFVGIVAVWLAKPLFQARAERQQQEAEEAVTDAKDVTVVKAQWDDYLGYGLFSSREFERLNAREGIRLAIELDAGDYANRFAKLQNGDIAIAAMPIDQFLKHSADNGHPAVIVAAIAESRGADAILAKKSRFPDGKVESLNDAGIQVVYPPGTPSEFLVNLTVNRLDGLYNLESSDKWRMEVPSPDEAYKRAIRGEGDAFVLWEPNVSRALAKNQDLIPIWGSDKFGGYIIDVVVVSKRVLAKQPDVVQKLLGNYFLALNTYVSDRSRLVTEISERSGTPKSEVDQQLRRIDWFDLAENCGDFFNIRPVFGADAKEGMVSAIQRISDVLVSSGSITESQRQQIADPFALIGSDTIRTLKDSMPGLVKGHGRTRRKFAALSEAQWNEIVAHPDGFTLKVPPIKFKPNSAELTEEAKASLNEVGQMLKDSFGPYRGIVKGHVGRANTALSLERAKVARQYLIAVGVIDANRLYAIGVGSSEPPEKRPGQSKRDHRLSFSRVEFIVHKEDTL